VCRQESLQVFVPVQDEVDLRRGLREDLIRASLEAQAKVEVRSQDILEAPMETCLPGPNRVLAAGHSVSA